MPYSIFQRQTELRANRLSTIAERRYRDALALCETGQNDRATGAQYLSGFVIEVLLKAQLLRQHAYARRGSSHGLTGSQRVIWDLVWRSHDLELMLDKLPHLRAALTAKGRSDGVHYFDELRSLCSTWTIFARYSAQSATIAQAEAMLDRVRKLKEVLK